MLHETKQRELTKYGAQETVRFKIAETDKSFGILFDNLYSDGISSIIRELWSNAYDSHIEAGITDRPFYCHIPTSFEPEFRVRDYGVSMPHSVVMGIYATMFGSTKDKDNVAVGKFGLGSKSPFAYIDTFTVTAIMDGEKRLYSAYLDAEGRPAISHMHTEPTDEATGVEISFPVDPKDVSEFRNKAVDVARAFSVRPSTNDDEIFNKINSIVPICEGTNWTAYT
ncbi:MAG: hypothetical protein KJP02_00295, partial [Octadecabacter sp.]|nr:hypothetical protein [Octadecabacter sp.]